MVENLDQSIDKYIFCSQINCKKFIAAQKSILENSESVFDAIFDVRAFVDSCCKTCSLQSKNK